MLHITIHQNGGVSVTMIQPGNQGHLVPESTRQMQDRDPRVPGRDVFENGERIVPASVEHINNPKDVTLRKTGRDRRKRLMKNWQPLFLVVNG
jgi:hypothetical protein